MNEGRRMLAGSRRIAVAAEGRFYLTMRSMATESATLAATMGGHDSG
ncbi:MAG: hypothetical protein ACP6IT_06685 [Candidatus Thorarchaeota archaeon]